MVDSRKSQPLTREAIVLAALSPAHGDLYTPVQVQKLFFLLDENVGNALGGPHFQFQPYHYGPFDKAVYSTLEGLASQGLAEIVPDRGNWKNYRLTSKGQALGEAALEGLEPKIAEYLVRASEFVRRLSFTELVSAIYKAYPRMRARSVFQD